MTVPNTTSTLDRIRARQARVGVICTDHSGFDYDALVQSGTLVVDTRNALKHHQAATIFRL